VCTQLDLTPGYEGLSNTMLTFAVQNLAARNTASDAVRHAGPAPPAPGRFSTAGDCVFATELPNVSYEGFPNASSFG